MRIRAAVAAGQPQPQATTDCNDIWHTGSCGSCGQSGRPAVEPQTQPQQCLACKAGEHVGQPGELCRCLNRGCRCDVIPDAAPVGVDPQEPPAMVPLDAVIAEFGYTRADLDDDGEHWCPECEVYYDGKGCPIAHTFGAGVDLPAPTQDEPTARDFLVAAIWSLRKAAMATRASNQRGWLRTAQEIESILADREAELAALDAVVELCPSPPNPRDNNAPR